MKGSAGHGRAWRRQSSNKGLQGDAARTPRALQAER